MKIENVQPACFLEPTPKSEYISKISVGLQELEKSIYWLELLTDAGLIAPQKLGNLIDEANERIAIFVTLPKRAKA